MKVHAIVHTTGVVIKNQYAPLELAYKDVEGFAVVFLINSPLSFRELKRRYPRASHPDVIMTTWRGTPLPAVQDFLRNRFEKLVRTYGPSVVFGYKGKNFQSGVLADAGILHTINLETLGVPSLPLLADLHPELTTMTCPWHRGLSKCARMAIDLISTTNVLEQDAVLPLDQVKPFRQL